MAEAAPPGRDSRLCLLGVVRGARGLKGDVRIESFTADPADIGAYGPLCDETGRRSWRLTVTGRTGKGQIVGRLEGVADRDAAEALKGVRLHVRRSALPPPAEDEYYEADLIGLRAETAAGEPLGKVKTVSDYGAGGVLEIDGGPEGSLEVPLSAAVVRKIDIGGGRIVIDPPEILEARPDAARPEEKAEEEKE